MKKKKRISSTELPAETEAGNTNPLPVQKPKKTIVQLVGDPPWEGKPWYHWNCPVTYFTRAGKKGDRQVTIHCGLYRYDWEAIIVGHELRWVLDAGITFEPREEK